MPEQAFSSKLERSYIDVILEDGTYHHFTPRVLNVLLESRRVHKFKRASGWATVGVDALRHAQKGGLLCYFSGMERRAVYP